MGMGKMDQTWVPSTDFRHLLYCYRATHFHIISDTYTSITNNKNYNNFNI